MKYSILMPYYRRPGHLHNTLVSFVHHYYERNDYEVLIMEDSKEIEDPEYYQALLGVLRRFENKVPIVHHRMTRRTWNPCLAYNKAAELAKGEYYLITNPECFHETNILRQLDVIMEYDLFKVNTYIICACANKKECNLYIDKVNDLGGVHEMWYQHSLGNNRRLHFCSVLSKDNWNKIGGFDEDFANGIAYEDVNFLERIYNAKLNVVLRDDLMTIHISHKYLFKPKPEELTVSNRALVFEKRKEMR